MATSGNSNNGEPTGVPVRKVIVGFVGGLVATAAVYAFNAYLLKADAQITPEVAAGLTTLVSVILAYIVPPAASEAVLP